MLLPRGWWLRTNVFCLTYRSCIHQTRAWIVFFMCLAAWIIPPWTAHFQHWPPVGVYIAIMGFVIALMALPKEPSGFEKFLWIIVITGLMFAEIRDIYRTSAKDAQTFQTIQQGLESTNAGLQQTAHGIRDALQGINMASLKIGSVSELAKENLENVTGGQSFAAITPQVWSGLVPIPLTIYNYGKQTLTGVTVTIRGRQAWDFIKNPNNPYSMYQAEASAINVGTLHSGQMKVLAQTITPMPENELLKTFNQNIDRYELDVAAQNFTVTEDLLFKKGAHVPWDFKYVVTLQYVKSRTRKRTTFGYRILQKTDWEGE